MIKEVYICDHCGKELDCMEDYTEMEIDDFNFWKKVDLCKNCYQELNDMIEKFISK